MKHEGPCPTCRGTKMLPMGHNLVWKGDMADAAKADWLECPDCGGTGVFVVYERRIEPKKIIVIGGGWNGDL